MEAAEKVFDYAIVSLMRTKKIIYSNEFKEAINIILQHRVWTIGIGKTALIAHKLASTLACNNIAAGYIHAGEALHGDFGAIQSNDCIIAFTNSGRTDEIKIIATRAIEMGIKIILITGNPKPDIPSNIIINYGEIKEACPLGLTPTTSITIMLTIADAIAMSIQQAKKISYDDYARNHHAGYLGTIARERKNQ